MSTYQYPDFGMLTADVETISKVIDERDLQVEAGYTPAHDDVAHFDSHFYDMIQKRVEKLQERDSGMDEAQQLLVEIAALAIASHAKMERRKVQQ